MTALEQGERSPVVQAALEYVEHGFRVLPLHVLKDDGACTCHLGAECHSRSRGKHPVPTRGCKDATDQPSLVEHWWSVRPWANIGIAMPEDVVVIDIDGRAGENEWAELTMRNPELPQTVEQRSGSGGRHLLFRIDAKKWRVTNKKLGGKGSKVDIIGQGKYIVAEPSVHASGGRYEWISDFRMGEEIAACPAWLLPHIAYERGKEQASEPQIFDGELHDTTVDRIASMFGFLDADDHHTWVQVGMALRIEFGDAAFDLWDRWSAMSHKYDQKVMAKKWKSFAEGSRELSPVTMSSIYRLAYQAGWTDPVGIEISHEVAEWLKPADIVVVEEEGDAEVATDELRPSQVFVHVAEFASDEEIEWTLHDLLPKGGLGVFYGPPASGKTMAAMDLALHMASGASEWAGIDIQSGPIGYIANEGIQGLRGRTYAWMHGRERPDAWIMPSPFQLDGQAAHDIIQGYKEHPVGLIVLDTTANAFVGDENSQEDMGKFLSFISAIRSKCSCSMIIVHHSGKHGGMERGSSVLRGAADLMMKFKPLSKGQFHAEDDKVKDGAGGVQLVGQIEEVELPSGRTRPRTNWQEGGDAIVGGAEEYILRRTLLETIRNTSHDLGLPATDISRAVGSKTGFEASIVRCKLPDWKAEGLIAYAKDGRSWCITDAGKEMVGGQ